MHRSQGHRLEMQSAREIAWFQLEAGASVLGDALAELVEMLSVEVICDHQRAGLQGREAGGTVSGADIQHRK